VLCRVRLTAILEVLLRCLVADPVALGFVFSVIGLLSVVPFKGCIGDQCSRKRQPLYSVPSACDCRQKVQTKLVFPVAVFWFVS
jgi:hypothetical protein